MRGNFHSLGQRFARLLPLLGVLLMAASLPAASPPPLPPPQPAAPLFKEKPFGPLPPPTETPAPRHFDDDEAPIPLGWIIAGAVAAVLVIALILYGSARAWRSSNIFDQQYRFPKNDNPALRFGGLRSGGHMATIHAAGSGHRKRSATLEAKDV